MKLFFSAFVLLSSFYSISYAQTQGSSAQLRIAIQMDLRTALWPEWRSVSGHFTNQQGVEIPLFELDPEIDEFLSSDDYRNIALGIMNRDYDLFFEAWSKTNEQMKRFFLSEIDPQTGQTPFHFLSSNDTVNEDVAVQILNELCPFKETREVNVRGYVYRGVNTNDYVSGATPLLNAVFNEEQRLVEALLECDVESDHANVLTGVTPLMLSAKNGDVDTFLTLINDGANTEALDVNGRRIFYYYNLGRLDDFEEGRPEEEQSSRFLIREFLEANGHSFSEEALLPQLGFSEAFDITLESSVLLGADQITPQNVQTIEIQATQNDLERLNLQKTEMENYLLAQCEYLGYVNCEVYEVDGLFTRESILTEPLSLSLPSSGESEALLIYKNIQVIVRVLGYRP